MTDTKCRFVASDQPRILPGRHRDECPDETCAGCLPCPMDHCRVCGVEHSVGACAGCVGEVRDSLADIVRMCEALLAEAVHRGVNSEAMVLLGPTVDPEAREHWEASVLAGRILPPECDAHDLADVRRWLETADDERHPLLVLGTWAMQYRDALEHDAPISRADVFTEAAYLDRHLTEAGAYPWTPFEDFARDLRQSITHLERVLHDGEQIDEGVPCLKCHRPLTRVWAYGKGEDGWECKRCRERSTEAQYRFAVKADYIAAAEWLTDVDMTVRTGVLPGTVRVWANRGFISRHLDSGRVVYSVAEVEARRDRDDLAS